MTTYNHRISDRPCRRCGELMMVSEWWDDPPEAGGDYLEDIYECTWCGWEYGA